MTAKLFKTLRDGNLDELEELIAKGAQVNEADKKGYTPLIECAGQGFTEGISVLLAAGANSSAKDKKDGRTALTVATVDGQDECVTALLNSPNASDFINSQDSDGMSALHWALKLQHGEIAKQLISHSGIKLNTVAEDGYTPLMYAVQTGNEEVVQTLLKHPGAKSTMNASDKTGNTPVHLAALLGYTTILDALLSSSPSLLSSPNTNGETPLHLAAAEGNTSVVKLLITKSADLKALTKDGLTPYQVSDPVSPAAKAIAAMTGETPSTAPPPKDDDDEIDEDDNQPEDTPVMETKLKEEPKSGVRKRVRPPASAMSTKRGKNSEESGNPLIARLLLVLVVGSTLTYLLSKLF